jgi:CheY-like chemotaxis protein
VAVAGVKTASVLNILIAEDSPDDVFILREAFRKAGVHHKLHVVSDGVEAVAYLNGEDSYANRTQYPFPDILLLDLNMPRLNGFEVLEWLRAEDHCRRLVVHILSASALEADIERAYELGANSYFVKPSRMDELVAFVSALNQWHHLISLPPKPESNKTETQRAT